MIALPNAAELDALPSVDVADVQACLDSLKPHAALTPEDRLGLTVLAISQRVVPVLWKPGEVAADWILDRANAVGLIGVMRVLGHRGPPYRWLRVFAHRMNCWTRGLLTTLPPNRPVHAERTPRERALFECVSAISRTGLRCDIKVAHAAARQAMASLRESGGDSLVEERSGRDSFELFRWCCPGKTGWIRRDDHGAIRVSAKAIRDGLEGAKLGFRRDREDREGPSIASLTDDHPDSRPPVEVELFETAESAAAVAGVVADVAANATPGSAVYVVARHFVLLESGQMTLVELAAQSGLAKSGLSVACQRVRSIVRRKLRID
jgi:hypothetical protein